MEKNQDKIIKEIIEQLTQMKKGYKKDDMDLKYINAVISKLLSNQKPK